MEKKFEFRTVNYLFALITVILLSSCGSDSGDNGLEFGTFDAVVSGEFNREFSGVAIFGIQQLGPPTGNIFVLSMNSTGTDIVFAVNVTMLTENRPQTGSFTLGNLDSGRTGEFVFFNPGEDQQNLFSDSGQLTISSSSADRLEGEVSFRAVSFQGDEEVNVTAKFNSTCTPQSIILCE